MESDLLTFKDAMSYLKTSRSTLYRMMWSGELTGYKMRAHWRFKKDDLDKCIKWTPAQPPDCLAPVKLK